MRHTVVVLKHLISGNYTSPMQIPVSYTHLDVYKRQQFLLIEESAVKIKEEKDKTTVPLNSVSYTSMKEQKESDNKKFDIVMKDDIANLVISNLNTDQMCIRDRCISFY